MPPDPDTTPGDPVSPALLSAIVASAMDAIVVLDDDQRILLFNPAAETLFRCSAAEALGGPLDRFLPARFRAAHRRQVEEFGATGATYRAMGHLRPLAALRADGEELPIEATISKVVVDGRPYFAAIVRDVTARREAEATAAARDRLQEILDDLPSGIALVAAPDGRVEFANAAMAALVAGSRAPSPSVVHGLDYVFRRADGAPLPDEEEPGARALWGERVNNLQLLLERPRGDPVPVAVHAAPLREEPGARARAIVVVQDVTRLRQAEQLKDDFLALISHEFRTPLTAIHGGARLLAGGAAGLDEATRAELLADVVAESERLDRLLGNLLSLTDVVAGRLRASTEPVLVGPLARRVAAEVGSRSRSHRFVVDAPPGLPPVEADPDLLEEVLRNLYENAVKYAPSGGPVRTDVARDGGEVAIRVSDEGIGIAPEHVGAVFERFRRVGGDPTVRGMGLGLYLSRSLVEAQGGGIAATSPGVGQGATFTVTLPVAVGWEEGEGL